MTFVLTKNMGRRGRVLLIAAVIAASLFGAYEFVARTDWEPIAKYRSLYIETAMGTMTHQYLARIFPQDVIDRTMADVEANFENNRIAGSVALDAVMDPADLEPTEAALSPWDEFHVIFPDVDVESLKSAGIDEQDLSGLDMEDMSGVTTVQGDRVYAINVPEQILIIDVRGDGYAGKLAIANDSSRTFLAVNRNEKRGTTVTDLVSENGAILGVNASGFYDPNGRGAGNVPVGLVIGNKVRSGEVRPGRYQIAGLDLGDNFVMGYDLDPAGLRDAMQFYPITVLDGENVTDGSFGMGIQPRTMVGQSRNKAMMFLVIDGRQVGHSLGVDVSTCADILVNYGCYAAMNMDGGSSSSMTYKDHMITRTSSPKSDGRYLPDAWVVGSIA